MCNIVDGYQDMLEEGYKECCRFGTSLTRLEYLSDYIFDFLTYDTEVAELFATKALEVCAAISNRKTFEYIEDTENYHWFLLMCNMPFFSSRLNYWGSSIRGAWWDTSQPNPTKLESYGLWLNGEQITQLRLSTDQWLAFIDALLNFQKGN